MLDRGVARASGLHEPRFINLGYAEVRKVPFERLTHVQGSRWGPPVRAGARHTRPVGTLAAVVSVCGAVPLPLPRGAVRAALPVPRAAPGAGERRRRRREFPFGALWEGAMRPGLT